MERLNAEHEIFDKWIRENYDELKYGLTIERAFDLKTNELNKTAFKRFFTKYFKHFGPIYCLKGIYKEHYKTKMED